MVLIGFNYLETPGKQISLLKKEKEKRKNFFLKRREENDGRKKKTNPNQTRLIHVFEQ